MRKLFLSMMLRQTPVSAVRCAGLVGVVAHLLVGCHTTGSREPEPMQVGPPPRSARATRGSSASHALRPNDTVALILTLPKSGTTGPYRLRRGDRVRIQGIAATPTELVAIVAPDGKVSVPLVGDVGAAGKTAEQLSTNLERRYAQYIRDPHIVVNPEAVAADADELRRAFSVGSSAGLEVIVDPSGMINLPRLGSVQVSGQSADALATMLTSRYARIVSGAQVSVTIRRLAPRQAYVFGMVVRPGPVNLNEAETLVQALAQVGGWTWTANLKQVVVFSRGTQRGPGAKRTVVNLAPLSHGHADGWTDVPLAPGDVVVVPKTQISDFNDFVEQVFVRGVYGILPISAGVNLYEPPQR